MANQKKGFNIGKCYRHSGGREMFICGHASTIVYGTGLVVVDCSGEAEQKKVFDLLTKKGHECRILTL